MLKTAICDLFGIEHPIIQGGMAHLGTAELVSAVSNAGGLGIIGAGYYQPDWVRQQIRLTKQQTSQPFGVNIQLTSTFTEQVKEELELFDQGRMYLGLIEGDIKDGWLLAGQIAGLIKEIKPVRVIIEEIIAEAETIITSLKNFHREN